MSVLRVTSRFAGVMWALLLAALALGVSLYCLNGLIGLGLGHARPDRLAHLSTARRETGRFLAQLQAPGPIAALSLLCGLAVVAAGLPLLKGIFTRSRERRVVLDDDASGSLTVQRRAMVQMLRALAGAPPEVCEVKRVKLSLKRRGDGGRIDLQTTSESDENPDEARSSIERAVSPLAEPFRLNSRIRTRLPSTVSERTS